MSDEIQVSIDKIRVVCTQSKLKGEYTYSDDEEVHGICKLLLENPNYDIWAPLLYEIIEEFDANVDLTLGSPGPMVHTLELKNPNFEQYLKESLSRKPTAVTMFMVSRICNSPDTKVEDWSKIIKDVVDHPHATVGAKEMATITLQEL